MVKIKDSAMPPNIVISNKAQAEQPSIAVDEFYFEGLMAEVIPAMALKYPTWTFTVDKTLTVRNEAVYPTPRAVAYVVYVNDIKLAFRGKIERGVSRLGGRTLHFYNHRIGKALHRGDCMSTTIPKRAMQIVAKWFAPPPFNEEMAEKVGDIAISLRNRSYHFSSMFEGLYNMLSVHVKTYILENIDDIFARCSEVAANMDKGMFVDAMGNREIAMGVHDLPANKKLTVIISGDKYVLQRAGTSFFTTTSEQLPAEVRSAVGMLKLVEDGQFVKDVGYRHKPDAFLVIYDGALI
jgi:hypothetical protein